MSNTRLCRICAETQWDQMVSYCPECKQNECHACWHRKHGCDDPACLAVQMEKADDAEVPA